MNGRTLHEICTKAGVSESGLHLILAGKRRPRLDTAIRIAAALGLGSVEQLFRVLP
jgi:transcriptional regulator with XRE-family HTH domain